MAVLKYHYVTVNPKYYSNPDELVRDNHGTHSADLSDTRLQLDHILESSNPHLLRMLDSLLPGRSPTSP